jgi:hypothetical protein
MPFPPVTTSIACPFCRQPITIQVRQIIDVHEEPQLKRDLLGGRLNAFTCPVCKNASALATPFLYHDADKELALLFIPMNLNVKEADQQRMIGRLTQAVLTSLTPEKRKAYLLQPQQFFNVKTLIETVLQADGVTPDMLAAEQKRFDFIQQLLDTTDGAALDTLITNHDADADLTLFQLISSALMGASADRQNPEVAQLTRVRDRLLALTTVGQKLNQQQQVIDAFTTDPSRETLLAQLEAAAEPEMRETLLALGRSFLDYPFFQVLTGQIDAARAAGQTAEVDRLTTLRKEILTVRDKIDAQAKAAIDAKINLLRDLAAAPENELEKRVQARAADVDDLFFEILAQNLQTAQQQGEQVALARLQKIGDAAMRVMQATQPPEVRFVNTLLQIEYPNQTRELLERNKPVLGPELIGWMEGLAEDLREDGRGEAADRLLRVIAQAKEVAGGVE